MSDYIDRSRTNLQAVLTRLDSILIPHGFSFQANASGVSSAGTFANGFYTRGPVRIGLIMRGENLGSPSYEYKRAMAGHHELVDALGRGNEAFLRFDDRLDKWELATTDGRPVLDALVTDLENIIIPTIVGNLRAYKKAIKAAHARHAASLYGKRR
jgi:hypothetical protein